MATRAHEVAGLEPDVAGFLDAAAVQQLVASPTYLAGRLDADEAAMVDPARLAWGLADAAEGLGVRIAEGTRLESLKKAGAAVAATTSGGVVRAKHVALATNVFPGPLRRNAWRVVPVYDYVLATEPLTEQQLEALRWDPGIGVADSGNQFHYYRLTPDRRILWGGYDAVYHYGRSIDAEHDDRPETFETLARNFAATFPQLEGIRFTHRWSGVIDTCTRFCAFYGTGPPRTHGVRRRLHRPRGRGVAVRRRRDARPARRRRDRADPAGDGPREAASVPAGTARLGRHPAHHPLAGPSRPDRTAQPVAADAGPARAGLRLLTAPPLGACGS